LQDRDIPVRVDSRPVSELYSEEEQNFLFLGIHSGNLSSPATTRNERSITQAGPEVRPSSDTDPRSSGSRGGGRGEEHGQGQAQGEGSQHGGGPEAAAGKGQPACIATEGKEHPAREASSTKDQSKGQPEAGGGAQCGGAGHATDKDEGGEAGVKHTSTGKGKSKAHTSINSTEGQEKEEEKHQQHGEAGQSEATGSPTAGGGREHGDPRGGGLQWRWQWEDEAGDTSLDGGEQRQ